jgi:hypothetical protein
VQKNTGVLATGNSLLRTCCDDGDEHWANKCPLLAQLQVACSQGTLAPSRASRGFHHCGSVVTAHHAELELRQSVRAPDHHSREQSSISATVGDCFHSSFRLASSQTICTDDRYYRKREVAMQQSKWAQIGQTCASGQSFSRQR